MEKGNRCMSIYRYNWLATTWKRRMFIVVAFIPLVIVYALIGMVQNVIYVINECWQGWNGYS